MPKVVRVAAKPVLAKPKQPARKVASAAAPAVKADYPVAKRSAPRRAAEPAAAVAVAARGAEPVEQVDKPVKLKSKLVRDSFTMPVADFALIDALKERALGFRRSTKKSELLRAGLQVLMSLPAAKLEKALANLEPLKPGRPKKGG